MSPSLTTAEQRAAFARDGVLVLRSFYDRARDVEPVQRGIHAIVGQVMKRHGRPDARARRCRCGGRNGCTRTAG